MATRIEVSVGSTTDVSCLAGQIKRFKRRVLRSTENDAGVSDRSAKVKVCLPRSCSYRREKGAE